MRSAPIFLGVTRGCGRSLATGGMVALAAAVCIGLIAPFFLPYLQMQDATGFERPLDGSVLRQHRRVADFVGVGASLVGAVSAEPYFAENPSEALFPGILAVVLGVWGAIIAVRRSGETATGNGRATSSDVAWFYIVPRSFAFWIDVRSEGRPLHAALLHRAGVLVPARAIADRHCRDVVPGRARCAGARQR